MQVAIGLTVQGLDQVEEVVHAFFQYIALLRGAGAARAARAARTACTARRAAVMGVSAGGMIVAQGPSSM